MGVGMLSPNLDAFGRYIATTRSGPTAKRYLIAVRQFLDWLDRYAPGKNVTQAPRDTLAQYALALLQGNYQSTTIRSHLAGITRYLRWLESKYSAQIPKFNEPELPRTKRKAVKDTLAPAALADYFEAAGMLEEPVRTAALLLPCSGLRCQEMVSLPLACLQRQRLQQVDGTTKDVLTLRVTGKGGHERLVPLLDEGAAVLVEYLRGWRRAHKNPRWLFPGRRGPMSTRALRNAVQLVRKPSGLLYTPHSMRRTYLTTLFRQGVSPTVLAKIAGHGNVQVLVNHYLQLDADDIAGAVHAAGGRLMKTKVKVKGTAP
jgi:site-specific recombinase XerD